MVLTCAEPIKIGLISDMSGALALYGVIDQPLLPVGHGVCLGRGRHGHRSTTSYQFGDCEVQVLLRDDKGSAD